MGAIGGIAAVAIGLLMSWAVVGGTTPRDFGGRARDPLAAADQRRAAGDRRGRAAGLYPARLAARISIVGSIGHFE